LESFTVDESRLTVSFGQEINGISVLHKTFGKLDSGYIYFNVSKKLS